MDSGWHIEMTGSTGWVVKHHDTTGYPSVNGVTHADSGSRRFRLYRLPYGQTAGPGRPLGGGAG